MDSEKNRLTRRQLLQRAGAIATGVAVSMLYGCVGSGTTNSDVTPVSDSGSSSATSSATATATPTPVADSFPQPAVLASQNGLLDVNMHIQMATNVVDGQTITTRTYEGKIGGPTLRVKPGDTLRFNVVNDLPPNPDQDTTYPDHNTPKHMNSTNNHTHGLHVSPSNNSDNIFVEVLPGETFQYEYHLPSDHPAGTYWYHPHKHGASAVQMLSGMGGTLIIEGDVDQVPEIAAARDIVFLINELNIDPDTGQVPDFIPPKPNPFTDEFPVETRLMTVNGQTNPTITCRPGEVIRLRLVCATVITFVPLVVEGHDLHVVAYDGITLPELLTTSDPVSMSPANRTDVLLKAGAAGTYLIKKQENAVTYADDPEVILATLVVSGDAVDMALPTKLPAPFTDIESSELTGKRAIVFAIGLNGPEGPPSEPIPHYLDFSINGQRFDPNVVNQSVNLNAVEEWTLINGSPSGHPFHIHVNPFQVISVNNTPLSKPEWRDTIMVPAFGQVVMRTRFLDFTGLYVLHCHILVHEDLGMMQTVNVM
jgi:FtsP/CotA-like multicopper oxidase with cupredoxin domain